MTEQLHVDYLTLLHKYLKKNYQSDILFSLSGKIKDLISNRLYLEEDSIGFLIKDLVQMGILTHWGKSIYQLHKQ
jgi:hypothetical protein